MNISSFLALIVSTISLVITFKANNRKKPNLKFRKIRNHRNFVINVNGESDNLGKLTYPDGLQIEIENSSEYSFYVIPVSIFNQSEVPITISSFYSDSKYLFDQLFDYELSHHLTDDNPNILKIARHKSPFQLPLRIEAYGVVKGTILFALDTPIDTMPKITIFAETPYKSFAYTIRDFDTYESFLRHR